MQRNERLLNVAVAVMAVCALIVTALAVRREFFPPRRHEPGAEVKRVDNWERFASAGEWIGNPQAPVRVIVFSDFQCPACRALFERTAALQARFPGRLGILYRHYPLANHPYARDAALASECAAKQDRFERYHQILFREQDALGMDAWSEMAQRAGVVDLARFDQCLKGGEAAARVAADVAAGDQLGIEGTPTSIVDGWKVTGTGAALDSLLQAALQRTGR